MVVERKMVCSGRGLGIVGPVVPEATLVCWTIHMAYRQWVEIWMPRTLVDVEWRNGLRGVVSELGLSMLVVGGAAPGLVGYCLSHQVLEDVWRAMTRYLRGFLTGWALNGDH